MKPKIVHTGFTSAQAGFAEDKDCTVTAMMHAYGLTYTQAHGLLASAGRKNKQAFTLGTTLWYWFNNTIEVQGKRVISYRKVVGQGFRIRQFLETHKRGTYIVGTRGHCLCVKNGVIYDNLGSRTYKRNHAVTTIFKIK